MFTLDRMTMFFFSLSDSYRNADVSSDEEQSALITSWSSQVTSGLKPRGVKNGKSTSNASTPTLTSGSSRISKPSKFLTSSRTAQNNNVRITEADNDIYDSAGAVSERDERDGGERARAAGSPPKGRGQRATSSVCYCVTLTL